MHEDLLVRVRIAETEPGRRRREGAARTLPELPGPHSRTQVAPRTFLAPLRLLRVTSLRTQTRFLFLCFLSSLTLFNLVGSFVFSFKHCSAFIRELVFLHCFASANPPS